MNYDFYKEILRTLRKSNTRFFFKSKKKNKHVENLKSNNDSLVKMNAYYDKKKSGKLSFRKGEIVAVGRNPKATGESTKTQPRCGGPIVCHRNTS
ncbi:hypothetical protein AVEN_4053-1 [Araneus ventricosus]|uniref:Uncharacterized protein n=1 Tax=Araneus ventricosus TaxID=182803 RepID=A0A4Y2MED4_ARAVE|nr:hypothetical protein AVEN_4053-1 [Araneus ventricosus]